MAEVHTFRNFKGMSLERDQNYTPHVERERESKLELVEEEELEVTDGGQIKLAPIEVKSGEEDEDVIYREKAIIHRFDEGEYKWKERGRGEARILREKSDSGVYRFILRRDGTGKLASNHHLSKGMTIQLKGNKHCIWHAFADSSDEEVQPETFMIAFGTPELSREFKKIFEDCISQCKK